MDRPDTLNYAEASTGWHAMLARNAAALCLYPLVLVASLYATWFMAWAELGHRPIPSLDDPTSISRTVDVLYFAFGPLLVGLFPALGLHVAFLIVMAVDDLRQRRLPGPRGAALYVVAAALWVGAILFLRADPWRVMDWYLD